MLFPLPGIPFLVLSSHLSWSLLTHPSGLNCSLKSLLGASKRLLIWSEWNWCGLRCKKPEVKKLNSSLCHCHPDPSTPNPSTLDIAPSLNTLCTFMPPGLCSRCSLCLGSSVLFHPSFISLVNTYLSKFSSNITSSVRLFKVLCVGRGTFLWFPRAPQSSGHTAGKVLIMLH